MTVSPLILQWSNHRLFRIPIEQRFDLDINIPVGTYSRTPGVNLGLNAFSVHPLLRDHSISHETDRDQLAC